MELRQAKDLAKSYYKTFYLDLSPNKIGFSGGIALISIFLFAFFLVASSALYLHKIQEASQYTYGLTLIFEALSILLLQITRQIQTKTNIQDNPTILPPHIEFESDNLQEYKKRWIETYFKTPHDQFSDLCESIESAYNKQQDLKRKAEGKFSGLLMRFIAFPKDRVITLLLAYISIIIAILGSNSFSLENFFEFYGNVSNYLTFSATISTTLAGICFSILMLATPIHLMANCLWQSVFKKTSCTKMTLYIFLRDCHQLSSIRRNQNS